MNTVKVVPASALRMAEQGLKNLKDSKAVKEKKWIATNLARVNSGWLRRVFKLRALTEEEFVANDESQFFGQLSAIRCSFFEVEEMIQGVKVAAEYAGLEGTGPLTLSVEDFRKLREWSDE